MSINNLPVRNFTRADPKVDPEVPAGNPFKHLIGIELELENIGPIENMNPSWMMVEDRSLRNGMEFISAGPRNGLKLKTHIKDFFSMKVRSKNSPRASTHIHVNVGDLNVEQVRTMFAISYALEEALFLCVNADRKFCGYCMPLSEMPAWRLNKVLGEINSAEWQSLMTGRNEDKYYGFNINSIYKHGTVEFRYFTAGPDETELTDWVMYCTYAKSAAKAGFAGLLALDTPDLFRGWLFEHFPTWAARLLDKMDETIMHGLLMEVLALLPDEEEFVRREPVVFVNEDLIEFVTRFYLTTPVAADKLRQMAKKMDVITENEWYDVLATCRQADRNAAAKMEREQYEREVAEMKERDAANRADLMRRLHAAQEQAIPKPAAPPRGAKPQPPRYDQMYVAIDEQVPARANPFLPRGNR